MDSLDGSAPFSDVSGTDGPFPGERTFTCRIVPGPSRRHTLHLTGSLHTGWAGRLAAGLAARHVSVVRAAARRTSTRWTAEIVFDVLDEDVQPSAIDFLALMNDHVPATRDGGRLALTSRRVARTRRDVLVEVRGEDTVGFLGRILHLFADLGLFPHEMRVDTRGLEVRDVFRLQSAVGEAPPEGIVEALRRRLDRLVRE
ncbi:hypothetical protein [Anaeromyxobacter oryzisoli]|uniref:hypothetical protein n=1 Tax=Anaeromyxobacter oryzisoli TaxID=2925408 RepID=UPI001F58B14F|nr:hypothetical protein [Anaeromyxobacter sp. SG63]